MHEGGFSVRERADGRLEFLRPDGRVIPRSGYRLEDMVDDEAEAGPERDDPSAEGSGGTENEPPTGVREPPGEYRVAGRSRGEFRMT